MKLNFEDIPGKLLGLVQMGAVGSMIGLFLLIMFNVESVNIVVCMGCIAMFVYTLLLSTAMFNVRMSKGVILIALTMLSHFFVTMAIPIIATAMGDCSRGIIEVYMYSMYINYALLMMCIVSWVIMVLDSLRPEELSPEEETEFNRPDNGL